MKRKFNSGDYIFFASCGMWLCLIGLWFMGHKSFANETVIYVVIIGIGGIALANIIEEKEIEK